MGLGVFLKLLWDSKLLVVAPGWAAIAILGYVEFFQLQPLEAEVSGVKESVEALLIENLEERLDAAYSALCMNPGDPALLERIRELQQDYRRIARVSYQPPDCDLLLKLK